MALKAHDDHSGSPRPQGSGLENRLFSEWIYTTEWVPLPNGAEQLRAAGSVPPAPWILLPSPSTLNLSAQWAEQLLKQGSHVQELRPSRADSTLNEELSQCLVAQNGFGATGSQDRREIVVFLGEESVEDQVAAALGVVQRLLNLGAKARVWFVAQLLVAGRLSLPAAALRGFSRSLGLEQPAIAGGWLALDPHTDAAAALAALRHAEGEDVLWLQGGTVLVPRLRRKVLSQGARPALQANRSYLVTGAFGRLGKGIVNWLAACGARHIVLIGRNPPDDTDDNWLRRKQEWESQQLHLRLESCDVADESAVRSLLARIAEDGSPVAGVVHAAAGMHFAPLPELRKADIVTAFRAKVEGAHVLDRCTRGLQMDLFVLFGSASATVGLRDGTLYSAANSCLDALAVERRTLGLPATCVEWGLWKAGTSALAVASTHLGRIESSGFHAMEDFGAFEALDAILASGDTTAVVADVDWRVLGPALRSLQRESLVSELLAPDRGSLPQSEGPALGSPWLESIRELSPEERFERLHELIAEKVAEICGLSSASEVDDTTGFFDLGMDSLSGIELQTYIEDSVGIRMQGTLSLNYPNVGALMRFLEDTLFPSAVPSPALKESANQSSSAASLTTDNQAAVGAMDDDEVERAIRAEMEAIEKLGVRCS